MQENKANNQSVDDLYDDEDEDMQRDMFLTFSVGAEDYGLEIKSVNEIIGIQKITEVPDMPVYVKGVINLRGKVIPVMDVRLRFCLPERTYDDRTCIVVVTVAGSSVGLVVDTVKDVADIPAEQIEPPPAVSDGNRQMYIKGLGKIGDEVKILLNVEKLVKNEDIEVVQSVAHTHTGAAVPAEAQ